MGLSLVVLVAVLALLVGVVSLLVLALGIRGRRIDEHPVCRRCAYDLIGLDPRPARCPECSADLARPGAVRTGARRKRRGLIGAGAIGLALTLLVGAVLAWGAARAFNWNTVKPAWVLEREMLGFGAFYDQGVIDELNARLLRGELEPERLARLAHHALALQSDPSAGWTAGYGDLIESAAGAGMLDDDSVDRYYATGVTTNLLVRDRVRAGERATIALRFNAPRLGSATYWFSIQPRECLLDGEPAGELLGSGMVGLSGGGGSGTISSSSLVVDEPGEHTLGARFDIEVRSAFNTPPLAVIPQSETLTLTVVPPGTPLYTLTAPPADRAAMRDAIAISRAVLQSPSEGLRLSASIDITQAPHAVACDVYMHWGEGERVRVGGLVGPPNSNHSAGMMVDLPEGFDATHADFEFVPSERVLASSLDLDTAWGETIWIRGVEITREPE